MILNNSKDQNFLSHFIREDIYLVKSDDQLPKPKEEKKKHLILTPDPLSESEEHFLQKIFAAVNIEPEHLELSQLSPERIGFSSVFYFGTEPKNSDLEYYTTDTEDGLTIVRAHRLSEIADDDSKKRQLWSVLKSLFH